MRPVTPKSVPPKIGPPTPIFIKKVAKNWSPGSILAAIISHPELILAAKSGKHMLAKIDPYAKRSSYPARACTLMA